jgi:hypothetical protein
MARWAAGIAGVVWIVAALGFGLFAFLAFVGVAMGDPELWVFAAASVIAAPVTFLLGLLLFAPSQRVLLWSTLWAALWAAIVAILVSMPDGGWGWLAFAIIVPIVAGLLSLLAWRRVP